MGRLYKVKEFAGLTGVSVRTLHHYDRIGLLKPSARTDTGYRLYAPSELLRLQQILTLRYLGFPLEEIGRLLERPDFDLEASMRIQGTVIRDRISTLERVGQALDELLQHRLTTGDWDWQLAIRASAAAREGLKYKEDTMSEYYSRDELAKRMQDVGKDIPQAEVQAVEQAWPPLLAEIRANRDLDPTSEKARELADRWGALVERTMRGFQGDPKIGATIAENYRQNVYADAEGAPTPEDFAFIKRVNEAR